MRGWDCRLADMSYRAVCRRLGNRGEEGRFLPIRWFTAPSLRVRRLTSSLASSRLKFRSARLALSSIRLHASCLSAFANVLSALRCRGRNHPSLRSVTWLVESFLFRPMFMPSLILGSLASAIQGF